MVETTRNMCFKFYPDFIPICGYMVSVVRIQLRLPLYREYFGDTFFLCFIESVGFDDHLTDSSSASISFASAGFGAGCSAGVYQQIEANKQKFFFIPIHMPPASIKIPPMKHALAVPVEPFKFSSR